MLVLQNKLVEKYLQEHQLQERFMNVCKHIEAGRFSQVQLKKREPLSLNIYQFRITKKYRALSIKEGNVLLVYKILDHQ